jgi:exonuclease III
MTQNNIGDPLTILNNHNDYDLINPLNLALGDSIDTNPYIDNRLNTLYYDLSPPPSPLISPNNVSFLSLNIRSLMRNHTHLNSLIANLTQNSSNVNAIALQETWAVPYPEVIHIDGFNFINKSRKQGRGGRVGFYLRETLKYKVINELSTFIDNEFESITIEIIINRKKILISNYYKPPQVPNENFFANLNNHLNNLAQRNTDTYVFSDTNINLLKLPNQNPAKDYLEIVHSSGFLQLISKATRILDGSYSLIDHVLCNNFNSDILTGTLLIDFSDHFMNFLTMPCVHSSADAKISKKPTRIFSLSSLNSFKNDLSALSWNDVISRNDVDASFDAFWENFSTLYDLHFPL